jgi:hypothetical protein
LPHFSLCICLLADAVLSIVPFTSHPDPTTPYFCYISCMILS